MFDEIKVKLINSKLDDLEHKKACLLKTKSKKLYTRLRLKRLDRKILKLYKELTEQINQELDEASFTASLELTDKNTEEF